MNITNVIILQLPYYIDGDVKVTQSNAILRYIGRKFDMCKQINVSTACHSREKIETRFLSCRSGGKTEAERVRVDMMENQVMDLRNGFVRLAYNAKDYVRLTNVLNELNHGQVHIPELYFRTISCPAT